MDKTLITLGAVLVAAGISAVPKARAAIALAGTGLVPLAAGLVLSSKREDERPA
ncbi:MAG: hypothetical protein V9G19_15260 [Tetrasphaera sp.]